MERENIRFGKFRAVIGTGELFCGGEKIEIQDKPFRILELLLRAPGGCISRERIQRQLWQGINVDAGRCLNTAMRKLRKSLGDSASHPTIIETVGNRGYRLLLKPVAPEATRSTINTSRITLVVLPFRNLSQDSYQYFCSALGEQMIAELGRTYPQLSLVTLRTGGDDYRYEEALSDLEGCYELSGSVLWSEPRFRITVQLVHLKGRVCRWTESFTCELGDIFNVQDEIARQISGTIRQLLPVHVFRQACLRTTPAIYDKYLRATYFAQKGEETSFSKAVGLLEGVIREDSEFAPAYVSLAMLFTAVGQYGMRPPKEIYRRVHELASEALRLNSCLPEAHAALGFEALFLQADFSLANARFLRAIELNPSCAAAHIGYGFLMSSLGHHEASIKAMQEARRFDPHSLMNLALTASAYCMAGQFSEALAYARQIVDMEPSFPTGHSCLGWILLSLNRCKEALSAFRESVTLCPQSSLMQAHLAYGLAVNRQDQESRGILEKLLHERESAWVSSYWIALIHSALGEDDTAFSWLETAIEECDGWRVFARSDMRTMRFRNQPRFDQWMTRLGFAAMHGLGKA